MALMLRTREAFNKIFSMFTWQNRPSIATPLGQTNLNKLNIAINTLDDRVVQLDAEKLDLDIANLMVSKFDMDMKTGIIKITQLNGVVKTFDLALEKIPTSFTMSETGIITMTNADGTKYTADIGNLIRQFTFSNSETIGFVTQTLANGIKRIQANVTPGTLDESHFKATFAQEIRDNKNAAVQSAKSASDNATLAINEAKKSADQAKMSESWAVGYTGKRTGENTNNSKYWSEESRNQANQAKLEADRAAQYSTIVAPRFHLDLDTGIVYQKPGAGVDFKLDDNCALCWKVL